MYEVLIFGKLFRRCGHKHRGSKNALECAETFKTPSVILVEIEKDREDVIKHRRRNSSGWVWFDGDFTGKEREKYFISFLKKPKPRAKRAKPQAKATKPAKIDLSGLRVVYPD
jgi:hypothetical protein